jgi:hypothetical protein
LDVVRPAGEEVDRELRVDAIQDFERLGQTSSIERQYDEQIDVGISSRPPMCVRTEKHHAVWLELVDDSIAQFENESLLNHPALHIGSIVRRMGAAGAVN